MDIAVNKNVVLTNIYASDSLDIAKHINDEEVHRNTLTIPFPYSENDAQQFIQKVLSFQNESGLQREWAIRFDNELVGCIGLLYNYGVESHKSEIGYWIGKAYRGRGIMTEVIGSFTQACLDSLGLIRLEANVFTFNKASSSILLKNNWNYEGLHRKSYMKNGEYLDSHFYAYVKF